MFDRYLLPVSKRFLTPLCRLLKKFNITANQVTWMAFLMNPFLFWAIYKGFFGVAVILLLANRIFDGIDGILARMTEKTQKGAFIDLVFDYVFYATIPLAFAFYDADKNALWAAVLLASFILTATTFLAFAASKTKQNEVSGDYPEKGFFFLGGLTEGVETIGFFLAFCIFPDFFPILATIFAFLCVVTFFYRLNFSIRRL